MLRSVMMSTARPNFMGFSFCSNNTLELHMKAWSGECVVMMTAKPFSASERTLSMTRTTLP